jgi:PEP-CTERM motif
MMKQIGALSLAMLASQAWAGNSFLNGGFEDGNLGSWTFGTGSRQGFNNPGSSGSQFSAANILPGGSLNVPSANHVSIVTPGNDPIVGAALNRVFAGGYSVRVEDSGTGYFASAIRQSVANYGASTINFSWAAVLEDQHGPTDAPFFQVTVRDDTTGSVVYNTQFAAYPGNPNANVFQTLGGVKYATWQSVAVNTVVGNNYSIELLAADCGQSGHFGYAYLDGFGSVAGGGGDNGQTGGGSVPLPGSMALLGLGMAAFMLRKKI